MSENTETAILAGGCFWGVQELLRRRDGIISTRVGYTGGENENPTYGNHPGHAEAVEIVFDPERISYRDILEFFFQIHDPTTKDRQGNDFGSDYRSEIFYLSDAQRRVAEETIADVDASGLWPGKVVTEVSEAVPFWVAEAEHQDYLQRYPNGYNCHFPRPGWKLPHRETPPRAAIAQRTAGGPSPMPGPTRSTRASDLVKVAYAQNEPEAEFLQGLLREAHVGSIVRRAPGFDVPEFLAAGPRHVLVSASDVAVAQDVLREVDHDQPGPPPRSGADRRSRVRAGLLIPVAFIVLVICLEADVVV